MAEKMLVTQALDERDLLVEKINDKIRKIKAVDVKKRNEDQTAVERMTVEDFKKGAESAYQQIMDLIARYEKIDAAIVASNAKTMIETTYGKYTVAGAIALRNRLRDDIGVGDSTNFELRLVKQFEQQYQAGVQMLESKNRMVDAQAESMRNSIVGRDNKVKDPTPLAVVDEFVKENTTEIVDPLDSKKKAQELNEKITTLLTELNTKIKVSNATTMISF
ncbi:MAG: hypothetical protein IJI34_10175 [Clostridia bacterium]|nr:hypothetical protein [Clostridia bacterium]